MSLVAIFPLKGEQISEALVLRRSEAGRFAYNLRVPGSPIRPHADTPTRSFVVAAPPFTVRRSQSAIRNSFTVHRLRFTAHWHPRRIANGERRTFLLARHFLLPIVQFRLWTQI